MLDDAIAGEAAVGRAPFVLHVVWHPQCAAAPAIAEELRRHFASDRYNDIAGGAGVTVLLRSADAPGSDAPPTIDWTGGEVVAVVALLDRATADGRWARYLQNIAAQADERGFATRVFPVALDAGALVGGLDVQALRWFHWPEGGEAGGRVDRLIRELTDQFSRMLRHWLSSQPDHADDELRRYRENVQVFLSHSKHDDQGQPVAKAIRGWFHDRAGQVASALLDEVFKDYLWQQRTAQYRLAASWTVFTSRPPELATAVAFADKPSDEESVIVHPDPPLGLEERGLFADTLPNVRLCALSQWLVGEQR